MNKLKALCKSQDVTITQFLSALIIFLTDFAINGDEATVAETAGLRKLRFLLSVGLRPFGSPKFYVDNSDNKDWTGKTVACAGRRIFNLTIYFQIII